jgi:hypothetical protein
VCGSTLLVLTTNCGGLVASSELSGSEAGEALAEASASGSFDASTPGDATTADADHGLEP